MKELTDEQAEALADEAERGYDITHLLPRKAEGWVYAALRSWASRNGGVRCTKDGAEITIRNLEGEELATVTVAIRN